MSFFITLRKFFPGDFSCRADRQRDRLVAVDPASQQSSIRVGQTEKIPCRTRRFPFFHSIGLSFSCPFSLFPLASASRPPIFTSLLLLPLFFLLRWPELFEDYTRVLELPSVRPSTAAETGRRPPPCFTQKVGRLTHSLILLLRLRRPLRGRRLCCARSHIYCTEQTIATISYELKILVYVKSEGGTHCNWVTHAFFRSVAASAIAGGDLKRARGRSRKHLYVVRSH